MIKCGPEVAVDPIRTTKTARLNNLEMYREDLDEFVAFFKRACTNVTISDNRNRYESLDEMKNHIGPRIKDLDIRGEKPALHFLLNRKEQISGSSAPAVFNELRTEEITEEADVLFYKVQEFLVAHQRPRVRVLFAIIATVALAGTIFFLVRDNSTQRPSLTLLVFTILFAGSTVAAFKIDNCLSLETRLNSPSFWARHQDAFAAHAVTATISTLVGLVIGWLVGHYLK